MIGVKGLEILKVMGLERERERLGFIGSDAKTKRYWGIGVYTHREKEILV